MSVSLFNEFNFHRGEKAFPNIQRRLVENVYNFTGQLNVSLINGSFANGSFANTTAQNGASDSSWPRPVGTLPLGEFIYILIGAIVFFICFFSIYEIVKIIIHSGHVFSPGHPKPATTPAYLDGKNRPSPHIINLAREEVEKQIFYPTNVQHSGLSEQPLPILPTNMPLPVLTEKVLIEHSSTEEISEEEIFQWKTQIKRKLELDKTILNLQWIGRVRRHPDASRGRIKNGGLEVALMRRAVLKEVINTTFERFREKSCQWSLEEWRVLEQIMEEVKK